jgi:hypothetical protein
MSASAASGRHSTDIWIVFAFQTPSVCGVDIDYLIAFKLPKVVVIKDRRLGILNLFFNLCIMSYVVIYLILYKNGSILYLPVIGGVTMQLQAPTLLTIVNGSHLDNTIPCCKDAQCAERYRFLEHPPLQTELCTGPPCDPEVPECYRYFEALQLLPYCTQSGLVDRATSYGADDRATNFNCTFWDASDAVHANEDGYLLTTRAYITNEIRHYSPEVAWANDGAVMDTVTNCGCSKVEDAKSCTEKGPIKDVSGISGLCEREVSLMLCSGVGPLRLPQDVACDEEQ